MKKLPLRYREAIAAISADLLALDYEHRTAVLNVYVFPAPDYRDDLRGKIYLEAYEKVSGGITFLNGWTPATPAGFREFFTALAERPNAFISPRPYQAWASMRRHDQRLRARGVQARVRRARPRCGRPLQTSLSRPDELVPSWSRCREFADWQGGVALPPKWDAAALAALDESLNEINYHSLAGVFGDAIATEQP